MDWTAEAYLQTHYPNDVVSFQAICDEFVKVNNFNYKKRL